MCLVATLIHFSLSILSLALIGFGPMIFNLLQTFWIYSCYLTLRERADAFYIVVLLAQTVYCVLRILGIGEPSDREVGAFQSLGNIIILCFLVIMGYLVGKAEWDFHQRGGLRARDWIADDDDDDEKLAANKKIELVDNTAGDKNDDAFKQAK